jgi:hypothetical protein
MRQTQQVQGAQRAGRRSREEYKLHVGDLIASEIVSGLEGALRYRYFDGLPCDGIAVVSSSRPRITADDHPVM